MIVTEEEAKTKRCQEGFAAAYGRPSVSYSAPINCLGSACMAWRWRGWQNTANRDLWFSAKEDAANYQTTDGAVPIRVGYCGKAGVP